jgi:RimJ/RimL family protein N-acetyltransferase
MNAHEWIKLELDVASFASDEFQIGVERVLHGGIVLTSLQELGNTTENQYRLFELNAECSADIPARGKFHTWQEYKRVRIETDSFDPAGVILALDGARWVGLSGLSHRDGVEYGFAEMTGTVRSHRRRGIATAMKVRGIGLASDLNLATIRTVHHPANAAMIGLNRRLGFIDATWDYPTR